MKLADILADLQRVSGKISTISAQQAIEQHRQGKACFVDVRDGFELLKYGLIPGAEHCPRGSLELRMPVGSSYHLSCFSQYERFVFYCSHGQRSILATHTAQKMGLAPVCHIEGGMIAWVKAGGAVASAPETLMS